MAAGTGLSAVRGHLRMHGYIHAIWTVAVLLAIIAALLLMLPNGDSVGSYISFAASIASLVLAVVAIGQSLVANQSFSETVGSLKSSADDVKTAATNVVEVSTALSGQSDLLLKEVTSLPPAVQALADKLDAFGPSETSSAQQSTLPLEAKDSLPAGPLPNGLKMALYSIARSYSTAKPIDADAMVTSTVWQSWISGALRTIRFFKILGIEIDEDRNGHLVITDVGRFDSMAMERSVATSEPAALPTAVFAEIQTYFSIPAPPHEEGEDGQRGDV